MGISVEYSFWDTIKFLASEKKEALLGVAGILKVDFETHDLGLDLEELLTLCLLQSKTMTCTVTDHAVKQTFLLVVKLDVLRVLLYVAQHFVDVDTGQSLELPFLRLAQRCFLTDLQLLLSYERSITKLFISANVVQEGVWRDQPLHFTVVR